MQTRSFLSSILFASTQALAGAFLLSMGACSATAEPSSEAGSTPEAELAQSHQKLDFVLCPSTATGTALRHKQANQIFAYLFANGPIPAGASASPWLLDRLQMARNYVNSGNIGLGNSPTDRTATVQMQTICGQKSVVYPFWVIEPRSDFPFAADAISGLGDAAETLWPGFKNFYADDGDSVTGTGWLIDPGTARLTANLSGSTGASASAIDLVDNSATTAKKWPGTYSSCTGTTCPKGGQPCSTGDVVSGTELTKHIVVAGTSYYACM